MYHLNNLNRNAYNESILTHCDERTFGFAFLARDWWDRHFSWREHGCIVLCDEEENHLAYIFYKIDRYNDYLTIHNLFTPHSLRRHGYGYELLKLIVDGAIQKSVKRIQMSCVSSALDFYLSMGFVYWGLNSVGDYYCNLPLSMESLDDLDKMIEESSIASLLGTQSQKIFNKVENNQLHLEKEQQQIYNSDMLKLQEHYFLDDLEKFVID